MSLSFILSNQSKLFSFKKTIFSEIFSSKNVEKVARSCGAMVRSRKLKIDKYIISALSVLSNSPNTNNLTMRCL